MFISFSWKYLWPKYKYSFPFTAFQNDLCRICIILYLFILGGEKTLKLFDTAGLWDGQMFFGASYT